MSVPGARSHVPAGRAGAGRARRDSGSRRRTDGARRGGVHGSGRPACGLRSTDRQAPDANDDARRPRRAGRRPIDCHRRRGAGAHELDGVDAPPRFGGAAGRRCARRAGAAARRAGARPAPLPASGRNRLRARRGPGARPFRRRGCRMGRRPALRMDARRRTRRRRRRDLAARLRSRADGSAQRNQPRPRQRRRFAVERGRARFAPARAREILVRHRRGRTGRRGSAGGDAGRCHHHARRHARRDVGRTCRLRRRRQSILATGWWPRASRAEPSCARFRAWSTTVRRSRSRDAGCRARWR